MSSSRARVTVLRKAVFACALFPAAIGMGNAQTAAASYQSDAPTEVTFHFSDYGDMPLKLAQVFVGETEVPLDKPVPVAGMWLRHLKIVLQNTSAKTVVEGYITLTYPETGTGTSERPVLGSTIAVGRLPERWYLKKDGTLRPHGAEAQSPRISAQPGAMLTFAFKQDDDLDSVQTRAVQMAGQLTRVDIALSKFSFSDETFWASGQFFVPSPPPALWKRVTAKEFYDASGTTDGP